MKDVPLLFKITTVFVGLECMRIRRFAFMQKNAPA